MPAADTAASLAVRTCLFVLLLPTSALAFPPYRSTDATTAEPWTVEARLGLFRIRHDSGDNAQFSPLLRVNLGLPGSVEIVSEYEHRVDDDGGSDAAVGVKWAPLRCGIDIGVETLALLPVGEGQGDAGVESQLLAAYRRESWRLHVNAGGMYDARPASNESGWR